MRRVASFLLTALILVNLFGFYTLFILKQADIKREMAEKITRFLPTEHHQMLSFSKEEFSKLVFNDNGNEFSLGGNLYDVVSIEHIGNHVHVTVEYDSKETALVDSFGETLGQQQSKDQNSSPLKTIISHFQQDYVVCQAPFCSINTTGLTGQVAIHKTSIPLSFVAGKLTPPPQFFLV